MSADMSLLHLYTFVACTQTDLPLHFTILSYSLHYESYNKLVIQTCYILHALHHVREVCLSFFLSDWIQKLQILLKLFPILFQACTNLILSDRHRLVGLA